MSKIDKENVRRRDQIMVSPDVLVIEEGFNVRGIGFSSDEYWEQEHVKEHVHNLSQAYEAGDYVPPIVVKFRESDQKAVVRDGHHRLRSIKMCLERGVPIQFVNVIEYKGDEAKQQLLMLKSSNTLQLSAVEKAEIFHRLHAYGFNPDEIAAQVGNSVQHVYQMLRIYDLPLEKKRLIQQKKLSVNAALAETSTRQKKFSPPKKAVKEVLELLSAKAEIHGDVVKAEIPLELWQKLLNPESLNQESEVDENQIGLELESETVN
ncbi:MAG: hypothetical protein KBC72_02855 [Acinetobacter sp.]|nr:hypothetical protein [Acinetobacter sp.]